ncbi:diguanylate cyclase [Gordonia sp. HNM0687]|uniref:Diguanylate cyclase n=1 Tax=Gordonia mangrovi TaxID=2665643 RepID=A0A6L7GVG6_9ACTN|nr:GGDEF domain-containing protein [Gordonia mangrovi]MXP23563.1 diguanylate cyclase [Gordonia mangrovi]UVF79631.1 GGDEF domain-containing protein [Gordonia mangrovi]
MFVDQNRSAGADNLGEEPHPARTAAYDDPLHVLDQIEISERLPRYGIAGLTLVVGLVGLIATTAPDGAAGSPARVAAIVFLSASTVPVAVVMARVHLGSIWWSEQPSLRSVNIAFVVYADLGLTAAFATFQNPVMGLHGTALFAVVSGYVAHFLRARPMLWHVVFTTAIIIGLGVRSALSGNLALPSVLYATMVSLAAANGTVVLLTIFSSESKKALRLQIESANTDPLTGVLNRRGFHYIATVGVPQGKPFTVAVVDIDNYKDVNDRYGHAVGDAVLTQVASMLVEVVGDNGVVGRLGGDEFAIAGALDKAAAIGLANRIRRLRFDVITERRITVSVGAVVYEGHTHPTGDETFVDTAIRAADRALFEAKNAGRDTYRVISGSSS